MQDLRPLYRRQLFEVLRKEGLAPLTTAQGERINAQKHHLLQRVLGLRNTRPLITTQAKSICLQLHYNAK